MMKKQKKNSLDSSHLKLLEQETRLVPVVEVLQLVNQDTHQFSRYYDRVELLDFLLKHKEIVNFSVCKGKFPV